MNIFFLITFLEKQFDFTVSSAKSIKLPPFQVVDLLVAMCRAALESPRKSIIFEPYPSVVDPNDPKTLAFNPKVSIFIGSKLLAKSILILFYSNI